MKGILIVDFRIDYLYNQNVDIILQNILKDIINLRPSLLKNGTKYLNIIQESYLEYLICLGFQKKDSETYLAKTNTIPILHNPLELCILNLNADILKQIIKLNKTKVLYFDDNSNFQKLKTSEPTCLSELN